MKIHRTLALLASLPIGCATMPPAPRALAPLAPAPVAVEAPDRAAALVALLGEDDFAKRESAGTELKKLGMEPSQQGAVVRALRAGATHLDPEVRGRARTILGMLDRSDSLIEAGRMSYAINAEKVELALRNFADGSVELMVRVNQQPEELFSGKGMADLAEKVNQAARSRGYAPEQFTMLPDGTMNMAGSSMQMGFKPEDHLVLGWSLWVSRVGPADRAHPGIQDAWRVDARTLDGRAFKAGLRIGDFVSEVDGQRPSSIGDLNRALETAKSIKVLRLQANEVELRP